MVAINTARPAYDQAHLYAVHQQRQRATVLIASVDFDIMSAIKRLNAVTGLLAVAARTPPWVVSIAF